MIVDVALHFALDMSGAATFACIMGRCNNPKHQHGSFVGWVGRHPWVTQSLAAVVIAYTAVRLIG